MCVHGVLVTFPAHFIQFDFLFTVRKLRKKHATHILSLFTVTDAVVAAERLFVAVAITFVHLFILFSLPNEFRSHYNRRHVLSCRSELDIIRIECANFAHDHGHCRQLILFKCFVTTFFYTLSICKFHKIAFNEPKNSFSFTLSHIHSITSPCFSAFWLHRCWSLEFGR